MENKTLSQAEKPASPPDSSSLEKTWAHTKINVLNVDHTWTISNYSFCAKKHSEKLESETFSIVGNDDVKWKLVLYPEGRSDSDDYVSLFLYLVCCDDVAIKAMITFVIYNDTMNEEQDVEFVYVFSKGSGHGYQQFVKRDYLFDPANKLLPNDRLTLGCKIAFSHGIVSVSGQGRRREFENPECTLRKNLELLFDTQKYADVEFIVGSRTFKAHKAILAVASPVFAAMFESGMTESERNCVDIVDIDKETFEEMLRFVYSGNANKIVNLAESLLKAADKYALDELKRICEDQLCKSLNAENACGVLVLADLHNADWLKEQVMKFIIFQSTDVTLTEQFRSMVAPHPHLLNEIIQGFSVKKDTQRL